MQRNRIQETENMNITSLATFLAIVDTGSLVRASQKLHVTQSTVTARLRTLEDELRQTLMNRNKSGITLTPAGTKLLRYARIMTGLWRQAGYETSLPAGFDSVCNFGCDRELWHFLGRAFLNGVIDGRPTFAASAHQGSASDLEGWLAAGLVDVILTYESVARGNQTTHVLPAEELILYSNRPNSPMRGDPLYLYVDHGDEYRRNHDEHYHDAGIARLGFNSSWWALQYMLDFGGSAYLPRALARPHIAAERLWPVADAPVFTRKRYFIVNDNAAQKWDWFKPLVERLSAPETPMGSFAASMQKR
jgi:DNA-binding transcriptional LysR family regulator